MLQPIIIFEMLILLLVANGAPVLAYWLLGDRYNSAIDGGVMFVDKRELLGRSKTWRGLVAAFSAVVVVSLILHVPISCGVLVAFGVIVGDLLSSFTKRRLGIPSHGDAPLIDLLPETLLPLLLVMPLLSINLLSVIIILFLFCCAELLLMKFGRRLGIY